MNYIISMMTAVFFTGCFTAGRSAQDKTIPAQTIDTTCRGIDSLAFVYKERGKLKSANGDKQGAIADYTRAMPEVATVVDNADPENLGRVKVKFMWQKLDDHPQHKTSDWIRVQTPDAGSSGAVEKNRGFFFVPEKGDQVMVGFELGDPNRPFVMGSLFYKENAGGIAENNKLKSITTRSGSTLTIDDDAHTILLCTSKANQIFIDEQNGVIAISSAEEINLTSKNINLNASENIILNAGKNYEVVVGEDFMCDVKGNSSETVSGDKKVSVVGKYGAATESNMIVNIADKLTAKINADTEIEIGGKAAIHSDGKMNISSNQPVDIAKK